MNEEAVKVQFSKPMVVLKVKDSYKAPYHKSKFIEIKKKHLKNKRYFLKHIQGSAIRWSNGTYELQYIMSQAGYSGLSATFARVDVKNGRISKIWKNSPFTKKEYCCWQFFSKRSR